MDDLIFEILTLSKNNKNGNQIRAILKTLSVPQTYKIQKFVKNILNGKITLNDSVYRQLSRHKFFLRYITNKFNINYILKNYNAFSEIMKIMLKQNHESREESSSDSLRRVESKQKTRGRGKCYYLTNKKNSDNPKNQRKCNSEEDKLEKEEGKKETETYENESSPECEETESESEESETDCSISDEE